MVFFKIGTGDLTGDLALMGGVAGAGLEVLECGLM